MEDIKGQVSEARVAFVKLVLMYGCEICKMNKR